MDMYREIILDHYRAPHHWGLLGSGAAHAAKSNPLCGDEMKVELDIIDGKISNLRFEGHGCAISIAAASLVSDFIEGQDAATVANLQLQTIEQLLGTTLQPARISCGLLGLQTVQAAVQASNH